MCASFAEARVSASRFSAAVNPGRTHEKRRPVPCLQRSPRHWSTTLYWRLMMHPTVQSFRAPNGVIASALAS
jgi:hypothetical protein